MRRILILCCLLVSFSLFAQNKSGIISGSVRDAEGKPLPAITVSLMKAKDSSLAKMAVSGKDGKYEFEKIPEGKYFITITAVGYEKKMSELIQLTEAENNVSVKPLELTQAAKSLSVGQGGQQ